jgi:peptide/nickel transport system permease protein
MAIRFRRHRVAVIASIVLAIMYAMVLVIEVLAPYNLHTRDVSHIYVPPQQVHMFHEGEFLGPFVYGLDYKLNMENLKREYVENTKKPLPLRFLCHGDKYDWWGVVPGDLHLMCRRREVRCSCSAPTGWGATCSRASSTACASRSPSASSASRCRSCWA